jgi:hypothetical protein
MIRLVAGRELRSAWRPLAVLVVMAAVWGAFTMTAVAGARRASSVVDRFRRATAASDATFAIKRDLDGTALRRALLAHPQVRAADSVWTAPTGLAWDRKTWIGLIAGETALWGVDLDRPLVLHGRLPSRDAATEVAVTQSAARLLDIETGDSLRISTFSKAELDAWRPIGGMYPGFNGPRVDATVVGIVRIASELQATSGSSEFVLVTPAFLERWRDEIGDNDRTVAAALRPDADADQVAADVSAELGQVVSVMTAEGSYARHVRNSAAVLRNGLLALAAIALGAGALVVGAGVGRVVRASARRVAPLGALGAAPRQRAAAITAPIALAAVVASAGATALAGWASRWLPIGPAAKAEPRPGVRLDVPVLTSGGSVVIIAMLAASAIAAGRDHAPAVSPATGMTAAVRAHLRPAAAIGWMAAVGTVGRRVRTAVVALSVAGVLAATWYAASLEDLRSAPSRWGYTWSSSPELGFSADRFGDAITTTLADPDVAGFARLVSDTALIEGQPVSISAFLIDGGTPPRPAVLAGRLPVTAGELALGRRTAERLGVGVGGTVSVASAIRPSTPWHVVGVIVPPALPVTTTPGDGGFITSADHLALFGDTPAGVYSILAYRDGVDVTSLESRLSAAPGWRFEQRSHARPPSAVANVTALTGLLPWLAGFFAVLALGLTGLGSSKLGGSRRHDVPILRAIGFTPADLRHSLLVEASVLGVSSIAIGATAGLVLGRALWRATISRLGVVPGQPSPLPFVAAAAAFTAVLGVVTIALGVRRAGDAARGGIRPSE